MLSRFSLADSSDEPINDGDGNDSVIVSPNGRFLKYSTVIGSGAQKTVYLGHDKKTGKSVAWCELMTEVADVYKRFSFRKEAELLTKLNHAHIIRNYAFWDVSGETQPNIVMITELMEAGTLKGYAEMIPKITPKILGYFCKQILSGLQYLHSYNPTIIHRDIKCDNIFVTGANAHLKIGDLGAAIKANEIEYPMAICGTQGFMAPEIYEGIYDESVDVYAFGMCILEMLTSEFPYWECSTLIEISNKVISGIKPQAFARVLDTDASALIEWCIQTEKENRPTCKDLIESELIRKLCTSEESMADVKQESPPSDQKLPLEMPSSSAAVVKQKAEDMEKALKDPKTDEHQSPPLDQKLPLEMPSSSATMVMQRAEDIEKALKDLTIDEHQSPPLDQKIPLDMPSSSAAMVMQRAEHMEKELRDIKTDEHQSPPLDQKLPLEMPFSSAAVVKQKAEDMENPLKDPKTDEHQSPLLDQKIPLEMPSSYAAVVKQKLEDMEKALKDPKTDKKDSTPKLTGAVPKVPQQQKSQK